MKAAKNPKAKLAPGAGRHAKKNEVKYPEPNDSPALMVEDVVGEYRKTPNPDILAFRSSLPYRLIGCAQSPMSNMPGSLYTFTYVLQKNGVRGKDLKMKLHKRPGIDF